MKVKIKDGCLVIRIPLGELPVDTIAVGGVVIHDSEGEVYAARSKTQPKPKKPLVHSEQCLNIRHAEILYTKAWPIHCRTCAAKGWIAGAEGQKRTCPRCLEFGLCPRCGSAALGKVSTEDGTYVVCNQGETACGWDQFQAMSRKAGAAEAAGLTAPVWRCECSTKEETDA